MMGGIELITANLGIGFENLLLFILMVTNLISYAKDFKLGVILGMIITAGLFIWFYQAGLDWTGALIAFFLHLVILAFTIFGAIKNPNTEVV